MERWHRLLSLRRKHEPPRPSPEWRGEAFFLEAFIRVLELFRLSSKVLQGCCVFFSTGLMQFCRASIPSCRVLIRLLEGLYGVS